MKKKTKRKIKALAIYWSMLAYASAIVYAATHTPPIGSLIVALLIPPVAVFLWVLWLCVEASVDSPFTDGRGPG